ncbi:MAG: hypothetical protein J6B10_03025 [Lachnospiraceae bacterium]|nr:hypothetical protein [Lachnospiraceae bacterium]
MTETAYMEFYDYREQAAMQSGTDSQILGQTGSVLNNGLMGKNNAASESRIIAVQFQPSSLQFQASAQAMSCFRGDISKPADEGKERRENAEPASPGNLTMSVSLIFDRTIYEDSDVTPQVEGFLAAVRSPFTRQVSFNWGELYYKGRITGIQVSYEMFTGSGVPMRAKMDITMALSDTSAQIG